MELREIDILIAWKVMELPEPDLKGFTDIPLPTEVSRDAMATVPPYSSDIACAWRVVEKLTTGERDGFQLRRNRYGHEYVCTLERDPSYSNYITAHAETAALAICLAALKSVGVEVNNG